MSIAELVSILLAIGAAPLLMEAVRGFKGWRSGRAQAEKSNNRNALGRLVAAEERADAEMSFRRAWQEQCSRLKRILIELGYPEDKLPADPIKPSRVKA
jgi:hypothetical protein